MNLKLQIEALSKSEALAETLKNAGIQSDPVIAAIFIDKMQSAQYRKDVFLCSFGL